jgi:hypothetical protein
MNDLIEPSGAPRPRFENVVVEAFRGCGTRIEARYSKSAGHGAPTRRAVPQSVSPPRDEDIGCEHDRKSLRKTGTR